MTKHAQTDLLLRIQQLVESEDILAALLSRKRMDLAYFFTTANPMEIYRAHRLILRTLQLKPIDLMWKAEFETDMDWKERTGRLWHVQRLVDACDRRCRHIAGGRYEKAARLDAEVTGAVVTSLRRQFLQEGIMNRTRMVVEPLFGPISYKIDPTLVFLLMPFGERWSDDVHMLVRDACTEAGLRLERADDIFSPSIVMNDIWAAINRAGLIIAEITLQNANVFYELGIAHTLGKTVILIRQESADSAPFDIAAWRHFRYATGVMAAKKFREEMGKVLELYKSETARGEPPRHSTASAR